LLLNNCIAFIECAFLSFITVSCTLLIVYLVCERVLLFLRFSAKGANKNLLQRLHQRLEPGLLLVYKV